MMQNEEEKKITRTETHSKRSVCHKSYREKERENQANK